MKVINVDLTDPGEPGPDLANGYYLVEIDGDRRIMGIFSNRLQTRLYMDGSAYTYHNPESIHTLNNFKILARINFQFH